MSNTPRKVLVLGIDSPVASRVYKWARAGHLPTIARLIDEGVYCNNCLVPFPTITPPNWTTIATGACAGTHGITDMTHHDPGTRLDRVYYPWDSSYNHAETIWEAAEKIGKKSIVFNWPCTWPPKMKDGYQIAGYGLGVNDFKRGLLRAEFGKQLLAYEMLLSTEPYPDSCDIILGKARGWNGVEHSADAMEAAVELSLPKPMVPMKPVTWHLLVDRSGDSGYDTVLVASSKTKAGVYCRLRQGEWSGNIEDVFETAEGPRQARFRMKLLELSPTADNLRIYLPGLFATSGWGYPESIEKEIVSERGLPCPSLGYRAWLGEWIDPQTWVEATALEHTFMVDATKYLFSKPWDMFFIHIHTPDMFYHAASADVELLVAADKDSVPMMQDLDLRLHQSVDRALGEIIEAAGDDALVVVVSDHGCKAKANQFNVNDVLERAGLTVFEPDEGPRAPVFREDMLTRKVDYSRTKALGVRFVHIYINLKGRDPDGIVEPEDYVSVQDEIIKALHEYVDPKTGLKPISLALRREDARLLGLFGNTVSDVVYAVDPRFASEHGYHLPTARFGSGDLRGLLIISGPGVKKGEILERNVSLMDVVPTICYLADLPVPAQCEGAVIYQSLEDPNAKSKEVQLLQRLVERQKRLLSHPPVC